MRFLPLGFGSLSHVTVLLKVQSVRALGREAVIPKTKCSLGISYEESDSFLLLLPRLLTIYA